MDGHADEARHREYMRNEDIGVWGGLAVLAAAVVALIGIGVVIGRYWL